MAEKDGYGDRFVLETEDDKVDTSTNDSLEQGSRQCCPQSKKMRCGLCIIGTIVFLALITLGGGCLFRNPTIFKYPLHASCNVTWTFQEKCDGVANKLIQQMEVWKTNATCGSGQKCLYTFGSIDGNILKGTHTTPKAGYTDDLEFKFYPNTASGGCNLVGFSTSRIFFAVLDFGTNYCSLHNLMEGSGLINDPNYSELTRDEVCTQYSAANCDKY
ncbi:uncharacterized protein LOC110848022 [Folsomia candida]|uniref:uncharacterized protein LOC110848022 n=1 Tax=Folsomia candida TaxID=158441 RepID=UPI001604CF4B|nr:uncharacterized protein LOC110848022 [Folsomia candida]